MILQDRPGMLEHLLDMDFEKYFEEKKISQITIFRTENDQKFLTESQEKMTKLKTQVRAKYDQILE